MPFATKQLAVVALPQGKYAKVAFEPGPAAPQGASEIPYKGDPVSKTGAIFDFSTGDRLSLAAAVTAQDGKVLRYFLDVRRMPPDSNADLSGIAGSAGILSPLSTPRMVSYTASLPSNVETVKLTLTTASPVAQSGATTVVTVPAAAGKVLTVSIIVTAEDGSQRLYRVNVSREALPVSAKDGNSRLASLQVTGVPAHAPVRPRDRRLRGESALQCRIRGRERAGGKPWRRRDGRRLAACACRAHGRGPHGDSEERHR